MRHLFIFITTMLVSLSVNAVRQALVIGNDSYAHITQLKTARADAKAMAKALEDVGFKVILKTDLNEKAMTRAIRDFKSGIAGGDEAVFFYAGHGVQIGGANYLLPIDLHGEDEAQVKDDAVPLQRVLDDLQEQKARFTLAIVDACRDNPFKGQGRNIGTRGLAPTSAADGQMVIFSAGTGQQALDRVGAADKNPNGLFTRVFIKEIEKPGIAVHDAVRNVRDEVVRLAKSVNHAQTPAIYDQSIGKFYFRRGKAAATISAEGAGRTEDIPLPAVALPDAEAALWAAVRQSNSADDYATYIAHYPSGKNADEAKRRLDNLKKHAQAAALQKEKEEWAKAEKLASLNGYRAYLNAYPKGIYSPLAQTRVSRLDATADSNTGVKGFKDCPDCPEMLTIPAGAFEMGSPSHEVGRAYVEDPVHPVTVPAFALGKFEVTRGQWAAFVRDTSYDSGDECLAGAGGAVNIENRSGRSWRDPGFAQDDSHPVVCVSWGDAQAYVEWLTRRTGKPYRLPSEAEWEYAARAGTTTARYWGNVENIACSFANVMDQTFKARFGGSWWNDHCDDGMVFSAPAGRYRPNAFGLHDMIGNVWEWTSDCWNTSYSGAPSNGSAWRSGDCKQRVTRGSAWNYRAEYARSATRFPFGSEHRVSVIGFRVALSHAKAD